MVSNAARSTYKYPTVHTAPQSVHSESGQNSGQDSGYCSQDEGDSPRRKLISSFESSSPDKVQPTVVPGIGKPSSQRTTSSSTCPTSRPANSLADIQATYGRNTTTSSRSNSSPSVASSGSVRSRGRRNSSQNIPKPAHSTLADTLMRWSRKWNSLRQPGQHQKARPQFDQSGNFIEFAGGTAVLGVSPDYDIYDTQFDGPHGQVYVYEVHYRKVPQKGSLPTTLRDRMNKLYHLCAIGHPPKQYNLHGSTFYFVRTRGSAASHYDPRLVGTQSTLDHRGLGMASTSARLLSSQQNIQRPASTSDTQQKFPSEFYKPVVRDFALDPTTSSKHASSKPSSVPGHTGGLPPPDDDAQRQTDGRLPRLSLSEYITMKRQGPKKFSETWHENYQHAHYNFISNKKDGTIYDNPEPVYLPRPRI